MAYTPGTDFSFGGGAYTPESDFDFLGGAAALSASGDGSAAFRSPSLAALSAGGEGAAAFANGTAPAWQASGEGSAAFRSLTLAALSASGDGSAAFRSLAQSALSARGEGAAAFAQPPAYGLCEVAAEAEGAAIAVPPAVAKRVARTRYTLVVTDTGTQEGMALPMSYLSVASRSGAPSAVTAVVPYVAPLADWLSGLAAARLDVYRSQTDNTGATSTALVQTATLDSLRQDIGAKNASITLTAHATLTCRAPKYVTLNGLSYLKTTTIGTVFTTAPT